MSKQGSLAACIAKMYEGGTLDSTASSGHGTPAKKVSLNPTNSMSAMDRKLSLLDSKVEKLVNNQGEVLMKLDIVYQGIGNLEKGLGKLKQVDEPVSSTEKKSEQIQFSEIKALCTETVKLLKSFQLDATKQKEKIDKMDNTMSAVDKVIRFVGETFKSSKVVEYILKGMVPWRKVSLLDEKREELEEPSAKLKTGVHNRGIQAEIKRFPEAVEKTLPDESISSDDIVHLQSLNQVEEKQKNANPSGEKSTKSKNLDFKKDTTSPLATAEHDQKPSKKTKEVTIKSREPTRSQTFDNDTYDISGTSSNYDASSCNKEETKNASLSVTSVHSEPLFSETNHQSKQATISSLESSSDTGRKTSSVLDEDHTTETLPVTQSNQVNLKASKMYTESMKAILEKQTECRTSLKPEGTSSKRKDSSIKKESSTPLTKSSCLSKPKNEQKPLVQDSKMSGMQKKDGNLLKQFSLEKSINEPHKEQGNQMKDSDPGGHEKEAGENSDAVRNCEEQPKAELSEAKSCTETTQKASLIVIDDSPPLPAPFEHRIVNAKQMAVTTCYSVSQYEVLGGGRFGQVHKCAELSSGLVLAAKIIKVKCSKDREEVKNEIGVMNQLNHVNLIQLYDAYESKNSLTLIMEYVDGGELFDRIIDENYHLTELDAIVFARQICEGVQYLHQQYILHLDLKPENILCVNNTGNQIKIIDFGLARRYKPREKLKVNFGTPEFLAPEVVNYDFVSFATDMWSVGVITYMLLSGLSPFLGDNDTETMNSILHGNWDFDAEAFENISAEAKDFISRLLVPEKSNRMSAAGCLKHDWLNNLADKAKRCQVRLKSQLLLQSYLAHRQWKKHFYAVAAANRLRKFHQRRTMNLV